MSEEGDYELKPEEKKPEPPRPKPGDPDWVEPVPVVEQAEEPESAEPVEPVDEDAEKHKAVAILGYILFVIPLVTAPHSKFGRFHANQGLMVFILWWVAIAGVVAMNIGI